jgi:hypothetical protein
MIQDLFTAKDAEDAETLKPVPLRPLWFWFGLGSESAQICAIRAARVADREPDDCFPRIFSIRVRIQCAGK